jgi:hypothetical protein
MEASHGGLVWRTLLERAESGPLNGIFIVSTIGADA